MTSHSREWMIQSHPAQLAPARKAVEQFARDGGLECHAVEQVGLCLNEALANIIRHAYGGAVDRPIRIQARTDPEGLWLDVRDWGSGVNPASIVTKPYDALTPGGVGLICLRLLMDEVIYEPQEDGMVLRMNKRRKSQ